MLSHSLCRASGADPTMLGVIHSSKVFFSPLFLFFLVRVSPPLLPHLFLWPNLSVLSKVL